MPSRILYGVETNEILRCQPKPFGSASMPSFETLCKSARVAPDQERYRITDIRESILTSDAKRLYEIKDGEATRKPKNKVKRKVSTGSNKKSKNKKLEERMDEIESKIDSVIERLNNKE